MDRNILITGCSGFIGYHLTELLCKRGINVVGVDNMNDYYDVNLKKQRLSKLQAFNNFTFFKVDICDRNEFKRIFSDNQFMCVVNLAAQAGVRYSIDNPQAYIDSNVAGFINVLELCKEYKIHSLIYASSSSVYGDCHNIPFSEKDNSIQPISLYGVTKKFNEEAACSYYNLFGLNSIGLRFFTVYGPWGRPDMALYKFVKNIEDGNEIEVYNYGKHSRSFTYVDDIVESISLLCDMYEEKNNFCEILNIGGDQTIQLLDFIDIIKNKLDKEVKMKLLPKQIGDIKSTVSDCSKLYDITNFKPQTDIKIGISKFIDWYREYHK